jgi:HPt (histidine-containing phosphotransfer) domain-containing protein
MALASEDEWETDPELRKMRADFVASFEGRWQAIEAALPGLRAGDPGFAASLGKVVAVAHKIAGAAESYGFASLTRVGAALEDWHDRRESGHDAALASEGAELLARMLRHCAATGKDAPELTADPVVAKLERE